MPSKENDRFRYIAGSDYFIQEETKKILDAVEDCETETFSGEDFSAELFFNFINTPALFSENKAALVRNSDKIKDAAGVIEKCAECIESLLIFTSSEPKTDKAVTQALKKAGFTVSAEAKASKFDISSRILQMFNNAGFKIDSAAAQELNEIFEGDLKRISGEIEKLSIYFAYKKPNSAADILSAVTARKQDSIFTFIDAYTERRRKTCAVLLNSFIQSGENLNILINLLFRRMREVYLYQNMKEAVKENRPWMLDKIKAGVRAWKHDDMINLTGKFAELDYKLKTGQTSADGYLTTLISLL